MERKISKADFKLVRQNFDISEKLATKPLNRSKEFYYALIANKYVLSGIIIFLTILMCALIFPLIWNEGALIKPSQQNQGIFKNGYILGTDTQGRKMWDLLWQATRYSLGLGFVVSLVNLIIGLTLGLLMGYYSKFDRAMQFLIKILTTIPSIIILIIVATIVQPSFWTILLGLVITGWINLSLQVRAQVLKNKQLDYFIASRILGTPWYKQILNFIPIVIPIVIAVVAISIPLVILLEASLAFIGISIPGAISLGNMIFKARTIALVFPYQIIIPVVMLILITISLQLFGNGLQDVIRKSQ